MGEAVTAFRTPEGDQNGIPAWSAALCGPAVLWDPEPPLAGPWLAHVPLLFWLIDAARPQQIAVVGDAVRPAFLAACQAVRRLGLETRIFGAFATPLPDEDEPAAARSWRGVGTQHRLGAEAALALLRQDPVQLLVLDAAAAAHGGGDAPAPWNAALTGPRLLLTEARAAVGWRAALADGDGLKVAGPKRGGLNVGGSDGAQLLILEGAEGPAAAALRVILAEPDRVATLRRGLERLGAGLVAAQAAHAATAEAERLEVAVATIAVRGDDAVAELVAARQQVAARQAEVAVAATALDAERQRAAGLEVSLRSAGTELSAARRSAAQQQARQETEIGAARQEAARLAGELAAMAGRLDDARRTLGDQLAVAEAQLVLVLRSTSWRLTRPLRSLLDGRPEIAGLLRRAARVVWWTVTLQLPSRWRMWRASRANHAASPAPAAAAPPPLPAPSRPAQSGTSSALGAALSGALVRVETLERRAAAQESVLDLERGRIDWALGAVEGVAAQIDAYHAYRETDAYGAAYGTTAPLISVCVATMDRADLLIERAITSLQAQTYRNLQIVVVGDNCTDDTAQRLAALRDDRIQFVNLAERGPYPRPGMDRWFVAGSNAMNHALSLSEGHFITHLDDDDAMVPHRIETLVAAALEDRADFLWHPFWYEYRDGTWTRLGDGRMELGQISTSSILYHRYFARFPWDVHAYRLREPGDWNRLRKIRLLRPRLRFVDEPLLFHHAERSQTPFAARYGERFLE